MSGKGNAATGIDHHLVVCCDVGQLTFEARF